MANVGAIHRLRSLRVNDVMNRNVVTVRARQAMDEVAREFCRRNISAAPVVDEKGACVGILSATDFLRRASAADPLPPSSRGQAPEHSRLVNDDEGAVTPTDAGDVAGSYMTRTVRTVNPQTLLLWAAMLMNQGHIHRVPVVDERHRVVGMISTMDVVAAILNAIDEMGLFTE